MRTSLPFALLLFVVCASSSQATSIGINHVGPGTGEWGSDGIASLVPAGVVAAGRPLLLRGEAESPRTTSTAFLRSL